MWLFRVCVSSLFQLVVTSPYISCGSLFLYLGMSLVRCGISLGRSFVRSFFSSRAM